MPKKKRILSGETARPAAHGPSPSGPKADGKRARAKSATAPKRAPTRKASAKTKAGKSPTRVSEPSDEAIRIRAYFIAERRHRLELSGDANTDWIEARRQLLSESNLG